MELMHIKVELFYSTYAFLVFGRLGYTKWIDFFHYCNFILLTFEKIKKPKYLINKQQLTTEKI